MAFRLFALPWSSSGLISLGYAAYGWLHAKRAQSGRTPAQTLPPHVEDVDPQSGVQHVPEQVALDHYSEQQPANSNARPAKTGGIRALFLGQASEALSPFDGPYWPPGSR